jgi:PIN domain nuclease of toxin-antitoxin system
MRLLLDTHTLIWALAEPEKLSPKIIQLIENPNNTIFISIATLWELQIKKSIGKIALPDNFWDQLPELGYQLLDITFSHILQLERLALLHRDPFDRILISQSLQESILLITKDSEILKYDLDNIISW